MARTIKGGHCRSASNYMYLSPLSVPTRTVTVGDSDIADVTVTKVNGEAVPGAHLQATIDGRAVGIEEGTAQANAAGVASIILDGLEEGLAKLIVLADKGGAATAPAAAAPARLINAAVTKPALYQGQRGEYTVTLVKADGSTPWGGQRVKISSANSHLEITSSTLTTNSDGIASASYIARKPGQAEISAVFVPSTGGPVPAEAVPVEVKKTRLVLDPDPNAGNVQMRNLDRRVLHAKLVDDSDGTTPIPNAGLNVEAMNSGAIKFFANGGLQNYYGGTSNADGSLDITIEAVGPGNCQIKVSVNRTEDETGGPLSRSWQVVVSN